MTLKGLIWIAALFVIAVGVALAGHAQQGHVILLYPPYRLDMTLHVLIGAVFALFVALYVVIRLFRSVWKMPERFAGFRSRSRTSKANAALREAIAHFHSGRFSRAEKSARSAAAIRENTDSAGLIGALAAHRMRETVRRDAWLDSIKGNAWWDAKLLALAEMQEDAHDPQAALVSLNALEVQGARRLRAQQLALRAHRDLHHWDDVLRIVKLLEKREAIDEASASQLRRQAAEHVLRERKHDAGKLLEGWKSLPSNTRLAPRVADLAAELLLELDRADDARRIVEQAVAEHWDGKLVRRYGSCGGSDPLPAIQRAETWQSAHPNDPDLSFALGALCIQQRLWGKAQSFLESALKHADHPATTVRTHRLLGDMYESLGDADNAARHYRESARAFDLH